ncbi:Xaa-Pro aminopeptidase ApepP [Pseudolycoriella hygida]|uniref:Xaa-Pro aminopeptidase ApepP n=1 Tax=Pseudolycoriella hygida TaxID=35572 RepID=A0A9Q0MHI0_9DIPT|nr:Xaa-Pro aminopeptidase ApepP [Pseudolycoriella hygida]
MKRNTKFVLGGVAGFVVLIACTVAVTLAVSLNGRNRPFSDDSKTSREIVDQIRRLMTDPEAVGSAIHAYLITSVDAHQSEYVAPADKRIYYVSSFSGSAGVVVITAEKALLWTDSRYHEQAEAELDLEVWTLMRSGNSGVETYQEWLAKNLEPNSVVGIDPKLIDSSSYQSLSTYLSNAGHTLKSIEKNLVDEVWDDKEPPHYAEIVVLPYKYSGRRVSEKLEDVRRELAAVGAESHIVVALDNIAWLLNLRGLDIPYNPVFYAYVIITPSELRLYVEQPTRITAEIVSHFTEEGVEVKVFDYSLVKSGLAEVVLENTSGKMLMSGTSQDIFEAVPESRRLIRTSPIVLLKVVKNDVEANGMREANIRDGAAVIQYLSWLDRNIDHMRITELSGARKLGEFREAQDAFRGLSFEAISAVGSNAAMAHYSPNEGTALPITRKEIYLLDSGGQYWDGTTDTTRTVHFGTPTDSEKEAFTRVLKGFISMGTATFPTKAPFSFFDAMARRALWDAGLNYGHGTGHGIGAYLNVHEYPPSIGSSNSEPGMLKNMFTSNEPGFYQEGKFGIRIEDVVQAVPAKILGDFNGVGALQFYHVTMVPLQTSLMKIELLTKQEIDWLNEYHERVFRNTDPVLERLNDADAREWLYEQTRPITYECSSI